VPAVGSSAVRLFGSRIMPFFYRDGPLRAVSFVSAASIHGFLPCQMLAIAAS
jgi:hypothetical protein